MIAITLNLLAEEQQAQVARARDPLKLVVIVGLMILTVAVAAGGILTATRNQKLAQLQNLQAQWNELSGDGTREDEFAKTRALAEEIVGMNHARNLLAPQLAIVKDLMPASVQISQLNFALAAESVGGDTSGGETGESKRPARPKEIIRLALRLEGTASSNRPELEVDQFLQTLRNDARFGAFVDDIQLRSISRAPFNPEKPGHSIPAANFVIECRYREKEAK